MSPRARASDWMRTMSDSDDGDALNEYSDEDDQGKIGLRPTKKQRLSHDESDEEDDAASEEEEVQRPVNGRKKRMDSSDEEDDLDDLEDEEDEEEDEDEAERSLPAITSKPLKSKSTGAKSTAVSSNLDITDPSKLQKLSALQLSTSRPTLKKTGVIYLSRIPPYMTPTQIRHLLTPFGPINRIFLSPEPPHLYQKRIKSGGNKKRQFVEGWVEFAKKKDAKWCAESLNAQQVGGKKGGWWYDDVWNLKYLKGFKWWHLTEQIANENAARQARLRAEIAQATRENKTYIRNVERAKMVETMQAAAKAKKRKAGDTNGADAPLEPEKVRRTFQQRTTLTKTVKAGEKGGKEKSEAMKKLLSSVF